MKTTSLRILIVLASLALSIPVFGQKHQVSGQVLDADTGEPVIGAGVMLSSGGGVSTDYDGKYVIMADDSDVLTFTSIGYTDVQETVGGRTVINVKLSQDNTVLEEVVVLGYTTQKKAELSSAVVTVNADKLTDITTPDVGNMRENIFLAWMQVTHRVTSSKASDFEIDGYTFEVGGKNKGQQQLRGTSDGYVVRDGIEYASRNTIPLWMFGFIY